MSNLLPISEQKKVWSTYRSRFIIVASIVMLVLAALASLTLIPSYLALELASPKPPEVPLGHATSTDDATQVARAQALIRAVSPLLTATTTPSSFILSALNDRPKGVVITHITFGGNAGQMSLVGSASPDVISAYRDALGEDAHFTAVSVPVNALVGSGSGQFSITLTGKF